MRSQQSLPTINDDAEYREGLRVQDELSRRYRAVTDEIAKERESRVVDVIGTETSRSDVIVQALELELGHQDEVKAKQPSKLAVLNAQLQQLHEAMGLQANALHRLRRDAGYRAFAKDDGGYQSASDKLLAAVDAVIAINEDLERRYSELQARGCDDIQHILFPTPFMVDDLARWRVALVESIRVLKETAQRYAAK